MYKGLKMRRDMAFSRNLSRMIVTETARAGLEGLTFCGIWWIPTIFQALDYLLRAQGIKRGRGVRFSSMCVFVGFCFDIWTLVDRLGLCLEWCFYFRYNSLVRLTETDFSGLNKLELLMLHSNGIHTIPPKTFSDLQALQVRLMWGRGRLMRWDVPTEATCS